MNTIEKVQSLYARLREENDEPRELPPTSSLAVHVAFAGLELRLPAILEELYTWHNGIYHLNAFLHFPPLREAVKTNRANQETGSSGRTFEIRPTWFPVLDLNGDIQDCVDVENAEFWIIDIEDGSCRKLADNYKTYLDAVIAAFERELASYDETSGAFEIDPEDWAAICTEFALEEPW